MIRKSISCAVRPGTIGGGVIDRHYALDPITSTWVSAPLSILAVHGVRSEEFRGRAEPVLATSTGRVRWFGTHLAVAAVGATALLAVTGLTFGLGAAISSGEGTLVWDLTAAHLARAPEVLVFMAAAALLFGIAPRALPLAWAVLVYAVLLAFFGPLLELPQWLHNVSPLDHIARMPLEDFALAPVLILTAVALAAAAVGLASFRRRDLSTTA